MWGQAVMRGAVGAGVLRTPFVASQQAKVLTASHCSTDGCGSCNQPAEVPQNLCRVCGRLCSSRRVSAAATSQSLSQSFSPTSSSPEGIVVAEVADPTAGTLARQQQLWGLQTVPFKVFSTSPAAVLTGAVVTEVADPTAGMSARQRQLWELQQRLRVSRKQNSDAVVAERRRAARPDNAQVCGSQPDCGSKS